MKVNTLKEILAQLSAQLNRLHPDKKPGQKTVFAAKAAASVTNSIFGGVRAALTCARLTGEQPALDYLEMTTAAKKAK